MSLAFYVVSKSYQFVNGDNPGPNPSAASRMLLCVFPAVAMVAASIIAFFLHFKENDEISDN